MRINKHIVFGFLILGLILTLGFYIITMPFRLVTMMDGEVAKPPQAKLYSENFENEFVLFKNYYLDERTFILYQRFDNYLSKIIIENKIDSLCWTETKIIGYTNKKYFIVDVFERDSNVIIYYNSRASLCKDTNLLKSYYNRYYNVPIMHGFASSKF